MKQQSNNNMFFIVIVMLVFFGVFSFYQHIQNKEMAAMLKATQERYQQSVAESVAQETKQEEEQPKEEKIVVNDKFDFYQKLTEQEITPLPDDLSDLQTFDTADPNLKQPDYVVTFDPSKERASGNKKYKINYIIQIKSLDDVEKADKLRLQAIQAGVDVRVVKTKKKDASCCKFIVMSNKFYSKKSAVLAQRKLEQSKIFSLLIMRTPKQ